MLKYIPLAKVKKNNTGENCCDDDKLFHVICFCLFELIYQRYVININITTFL
jgi:hypothetical protein